MKKFLKDFSAGKIEVKYYLTKPLYAKKKRVIISIVVSLLSAAISIFIAKALDSSDVNSWMIVIVMFFTIIVPIYILGKIVLRYEIVGKIYFHDEYLSIESENNQKIEYRNLIKIEYCGNLQKSYLSGTHTSKDYQTYKVRFFTGIKESFTIEVNKEMFLLPSEKNEFSSPYPQLLWTLTEVKPKYGISENLNLRRA